MGRPPMICPHGNLGVAKCVECNREAQRKSDKRNQRRRERLLTEPGYRERVNAESRERARRLRADPISREKLNEHEREYRRERRLLEPEWAAQRHRQWRGKYPVEATIEAHLKQHVEIRGGMCPKFNDPGRRGAPDRLVCMPGHPTYFVELKRPKIGVLDPHQQRYHSSLREAGQRVFVLWSKEDVDAFFAGI
jgi:hypothetical protein